MGMPSALTFCDRAEIELLITIIIILKNPTRPSLTAAGEKRTPNPRQSKEYPQQQVEFVSMLDFIIVFLEPRICCKVHESGQVTDNEDAEGC